MFRYSRSVGIGSHWQDLGKRFDRGHARGWAITKEARGGGTLSGALDRPPPVIFERAKEGGPHKLPRA